MYAMTIEQIKEMLETKGFKYTKDVKSMIAAEAAKYGIEVPKCACKNKWVDALMEIYHIMKKRPQNGSNEATVGTNDKYIFLCRHEIFYKGERYSGITPKSKIERLKAENPRLFKQIYRAL